MKRLAIMTVGMTHSGKTTFAKKLEKSLVDSLVIDQDRHAEFIHTYYNKVQAKTGPNIFKHSLSKFIVDYVKEQTDFHIIMSNANRKKEDRRYLLNEVFPREEFIRIIVHFDIPYKILLNRVRNSKRSTIIFRTASSFEEVLLKQKLANQLSKTPNPTKDEADYLFLIKNNDDVDSVIEEILHLSKL